VGPSASSGGKGEPSIADIACDRSLAEGRQLKDEVSRAAAGIKDEVILRIYPPAQ
jgi:hypothetical protein